MAWFSLTAVLFLQLAVAAYACPTPNVDGAPFSSVAGAASQPCHTVDQERPKLCEQHCVYAAQSVDTQPHSVVQPPVSPAISIVVEPHRRIPARTRDLSEVVVASATPPPLVRFGVLRI